MTTLQFEKYLKAHNLLDANFKEIKSQLRNDGLDYYHNDVIKMAMAHVKEKLVDITATSIITTDGNKLFYQSKF